MNSVYNYEYNKEIKDKLKAMINDKASSSETALVPAYSYLAEVLREVNKSYDEIKLKNIDALLYESEVVTALELMQNIFSLYYLKVPVDIIDFNNLLDICKDIRNKEVEIITLDNEQMEILPVDPKDFNKKMEKLKKFSENLPKETSLPKFRTSVGFLERIVSMSSSYSVTGSDLNSLTEVIEEKLIDQNEVIVRTIQEFNTIYETFSALDEGYINGILDALEGAEKGIEDGERNQNEIKQIIKTIEAEVLNNKIDFENKTKKADEEIEGLRSLKEALSKELKKTQIISFVSIAATLILGILIVSKVL